MFYFSYFSKCKAHVLESINYCAKWYVYSDRFYYEGGNLQDSFTIHLEYVFTYNWIDKL